MHDTFHHRDAAFHARMQLPTLSGCTHVPPRPLPLKSNLSYIFLTSRQLKAGEKSRAPALESAAFRLRDACENPGEVRVQPRKDASIWSAVQPFFYV